MTLVCSRKLVLAGNNFKLCQNEPANTNFLETEREREREKQKTILFTGEILSCHKLFMINNPLRHSVCVAPGSEGLFSSAVFFFFSFFFFLPPIWTRTASDSRTEQEIRKRCRKHPDSLFIHCWTKHRARNFGDADSGKTWCTRACSDALQPTVI